MSKSGGHEGFVIGSRPREYARTPQQLRLARASEACGIRKGMSRDALVRAMTECIPEYFRKEKERAPDGGTDAQALHG